MEHQANVKLRCPLLTENPGREGKVRWVGRGTRTRAHKHVHVHLHRLTHSRLLVMVHNIKHP
jgi:hypothetical protein